MDKHQLDFLYQTQFRLNSNQKTLQNNQKTALIKKEKRSLEKYNHLKHVTISSLSG